MPSQRISHRVCFLSLAGPSPAALRVVLDLEKGDDCEGDDCDPLMFVLLFQSVPAVSQGNSVLLVA